MFEEEPKKKRQPNKWQLFLKDCSPRQDKSMGMGQKMSACSVEYKTLKEKDPKKLDEIIAKAMQEQDIKTITDDIITGKITTDKITTTKEDENDKFNTNIIGSTIRRTSNDRKEKSR